jgi:hypothetical protein
MVPNAQLTEKTKAGYQTTPKTQFEKDRPGKGISLEGSGGAAWDMLKGMVPPDPTGGRSLLDPKAWFDPEKAKFDPLHGGIAEAVGETKAGFERGGDARAKLGEGTTSGLASLFGLGSGKRMAEHAARGEGGAIIGEAAVPATMAVVGYALPKVFKPVGRYIEKTPTGKFLKELTKSKVTKMEEAATAKAVKLTADYEKEVAAHQENVVKTEQINKERIADHHEKLRRIEERHQQRMAEHQSTVKEMDLDFQNKVAEHNERVTQIKEQYAKDLQAHQGVVGETKGAAAEASAKASVAEAKKGLAVQHQNDLAGLVKENLELTNKQISKELGKEFETVQAAVEAKKPYFEYKPVADAVKEGRRKLVMPESNKILDTMLGPEAETSGLDYATGRQLYSKLNEYLYAGSDLPSDVYGAVKGVRDAIGKQIQASANSVGLGGKLSKAMRDWSEYKSTWADKSSIAKGGSPIRRILDAEDPSFVVDQLKGKAGERLLEDIGKYSKYGADKALAGRLKGFIARIQEMPASAGEIPRAPKRPEFPKTPERGVAPKTPERGYPPKEPKPKELPKAPERPVIEPFDREAAARQALIDRIKQIGGIGGGVLTGELLYKLLAGGSGGGAVPGGH